jgi:Ran-interacting Mog1 protein
MTEYSNRQPVPDHQEAFLTPSGPFSAELILEITASVDLGGDEYLVDHDRNLAAVRYYMDDLTEATNDSWKSVEDPQRVYFESSSMNQYAAYYLEAEITDRSSPTKPYFHDSLPDRVPQPHSWLHLLFVRLPQYGSEFVIQFSVKKGNLSAEENSRIATQIVHQIVKTLDFKNFKALIPTPPGDTEHFDAMMTEDAEETSTSLADGAERLRNVSPR